MYEKLKTLSIEELEVESEDIDISISKLYEEEANIMSQISDLEDSKCAIDKKIIGLRSLSELISDLILEKQREEAQ